MAQSTSPLDDQQTAQAVDDIVAHESDELLADEDEKRLAASHPPDKHPFLHRVKQAWIDWWSDPKKRWGTIAGLAVAALIVGVVPGSRYFVLNSVGIRASVSLEITDKSTLQPLKNVEVTVHGITKQTDSNGRVRLEDVRLGRTDLKIRRYAFAVITRPVTIGWGSNPLGDFQMTPTGAQYSFVVSDYLSGKPLSGIEASSGRRASAFSDKTGKILLTVEDPPEKIDIAITGEGYRKEAFTIPASATGEHKLNLAPARWHAFVSKRSGTLDLYKIYADGRGEETVLKGTGTERDDIALVPHPTDNVVAFVSTRDNKRNADGFLMSTLSVVHLDTNQVEEIATSERIQLIGWVKNRLVYVRVAAGTSGNNPQRHRLISYDYETKDVRELAATNTFNNVLLAIDRIYYAPAGAYQNGVNVSLFRVAADGNNREVILNQEVWNLFRTSYDGLVITAGGGDWFDLALSEKNPTKLRGEPANLSSRLYVDSPDGKNSLWVDQRDGKGVLLNYDIKASKDKVLQTQSGLAYPNSWLSNSATVYRIRTDQETADYALSLNGGQPKKIRDVTNTTGLNQWNYY